ncbi:MAG: hypothetical protein ACXU95_14930, partial [Isosphaeraceae bacterium]
FALSGLGARVPDLTTRMLIQPSDPENAIAEFDQELWKRAAGDYSNHPGAARTRAGSPPPGQGPLPSTLSWMGNKTSRVMVSYVSTTGQAGSGHPKVAGLGLLSAILSPARKNPRCNQKRCAKSSGYGQPVRKPRTVCSGSRVPSA